jgi:hypothetical protein
LTVSRLNESRAGRLLVLAVVLQVMGAAAGVAIWRHGVQPATAKFSRLETGVPAGVPLTIESGLTAATERARAWSPEASLFAVGMQLEWPTEGAGVTSHEIPGGGWIIYTFASGRGGNGRATLSLMVDRVSGVVVDEREERWSWDPRRRLDLATYPISSTVALYATELGIGGAYRAACPTMRHLTRVSAMPAEEPNGHPQWVVTYEDERFPSNPGVLARIDAVDGTVDRVVEPPAGERSCDGGR